MVKRNFGWMCLGIAVAASTAANAEVRILSAESDPSKPNYFTVNFPPELGGPQTADIVRTVFAISVDPDAESASILSWYQQVNPLLLGGVDTGNILVTLADDSNGRFSQQDNMGEFITEEVYAVHFEGDLSQFGLESPFIVPSSSSGTVEFDGNGGGTISMDWGGEGQIGDFTFTYACAVNATFDQAIDCNQVKKVSAKCRPNRVVAKAKTRNGVADGSLVVLQAADQMGGEPLAATVNNRKARAVFRNRTGAQTVSVLGDADCPAAVEVDCP